MIKEKDSNLLFSTSAENNADLCRNLSNFNKLSLLDIRNNVTEILNLIGKTEDIFATYTLHNIKHVDFMLDMLEWLIPNKTKEIMSSVDWLLIVLSIYFHDLGMFVSKEEYENREKNDDFKRFVNNIQSDPKLAEYKLRIESIVENERSSFLYQEYVRKNHALRVKQWILGNPPYYYGESIRKIVNVIQDLLNGLPKRFLNNLADVCSSHDDDNIYDTKIFPLCERYGNNRLEYANVQYAAIILRTVDLIHITKDRTPSAMFNLISISDFKGIEAWKTHMETSSVYMKHNNFNNDDVDSHIIEVKADFSDEYLFFTLTEYISWADEQIKQTKRWADISIKTQEGSNYWFPWHSIIGDIRVEGNSPLPLKFELDRGKLLDLLVGHTIYNDPMVAIRELLQNAIDAVRYQYYLECKNTPVNGIHPNMGKIQVKWNSIEKELIVEDTGIGMNDDVIKYHLMRVGSSFYNTEDFKNKYIDFSPISRFGIGILTCFMISDNIEVVTCKDSNGYRVKMRSVHANYLLKELPKGAKELEGIEPHGTRIRLKIRSTIDLSKANIRDILKYWIILPECEVTYIENSMAPENIGFKSISDALKHFYLNEPNSKILFDDSNEEIITFSENSKDKVFELAFGVRKGYLPEKVFLKNYKQKSNTPAVCIEGIRVSNDLPGFYTHSTERICALLSIRGNNKIKTTVSRSGLEYDEEYDEVEKRCCNLLFNHIHTEIDRISNRNSTSLSLASSAGFFIYSSIISCTPNLKILKHLEEKLDQLPLVVIESSNKEGDNYVTQRNLVSLSELKTMESFWTIESRLADNLGIISRDLGKELSYSDFILKNSPELFIPDINPIVFDIMEVKEKVVLSHTIDIVLFSREKQQSLIKWIKNSNSIELRLIDVLNDKDVLEASSFFIKEYTAISKYIKSSSFQKLIFGIKVANIEGDINDVIGVDTRLVKVYKFGSPLADFWTCIKEAIVKLYDSNRLNDVVMILSTASMYSLLYDQSVSLRHRMDYAYDNNNIFDSWKEIATKSNKIFEDIDIKCQFPTNLIEISSKGDKWFSAVKYWRDWFKMR